MSFFRWLFSRPTAEHRSRADKALADLEAYILEQEAVYGRQRDLVSRIQKLDSEVAVLRDWASKLKR